VNPFQGPVREQFLARLETGEILGARPNPVYRLWPVVTLLDAFFFVGEILKEIGCRYYSESGEVGFKRTWDDGMVYFWVALHQPDFKGGLAVRRHSSVSGYEKRVDWTGDGKGIPLDKHFMAQRVIDAANILEVAAKAFNMRDGHKAEQALGMIEDIMVLAEEGTTE